MEIDTLHQIDTGLDPVTAEREQWDDGNNTLAIAPRVAVAYERNHETNSRLEEAGIEVVRIAGSELGSGRGGPRCMSCPVTRAAAHPATDRPGQKRPGRCRRGMRQRPGVAKLRAERAGRHNSPRQFGRSAFSAG